MAKPRGWAVAVRLPDGSMHYLCPDGSRRGGQDKWSPRVNQAVVSESKEVAERLADTLTTNGAAKEYLAVSL